MKFSERAYRAATKRLPVDWAVRLDLMRPSYRESWGGPMNGQRLRCELVREIFRTARFAEVIETGSFRGTTTRFLAEASALPVHSVELIERFHKFAMARCDDPRVRLVHGDSRQFLRELADRPVRPPAFFYLDAHWQEDVPRHEELRTIHASWHDAVVMIDDFEVPDDLGYGVAMYGGHRLTEAYLPPLPGWSRFFPAIASSDETGARRGCVVLCSPRYAADLEALPLLRDRRDL